MTTLSERSDLHIKTPAPSRALHYLPLTAFLLDLVAMLIAGLVAVVGRNHLGFFHDPANVVDGATDAAPFIAAGWLAMIAVMGGYRSDIFGAGPDEFKCVLNASAYAVALITGGCFLAGVSLSRGFLLLAFVVGVPLLLVGRFGLRRALRSARARGSLLQRVVIAGGPAQVNDIAGVLRRERWLGYQLVGALVPGGVAGTETVSGIPVIGDADNHAELAKLEGVDVIFFTGGTSRSAQELRQIVWQLEEHAVQLVMAPAITDFSSERVRARPVGGLPLIHLEAPRWVFASRWAKRSFDLVFSSLLICACAPILLYAALRVKLHDRGPIFFRQVRVGKDGVEFGCFKFRTMVVNAEAMVAKLQQEQGTDALLFKMKDDPRITKPGKFLRRFSLDELPQLFNVFLGDMSLVGPRPQVPREVALYDDALRRRLNVRPGMTGLWQVSGRNDLSVEDSVRLDLYYVDNWSMLQDLSILVRTFGAVLGSKGAY